MPLRTSVAVRRLLCLLVLLSAPCAFAQKTIRVPADQPTIQGAINGAADGDSVVVSAGTYYENIDYKGKSISVVSASGAAATILDGGLAGPVVTITGINYPSQTLKGFTIRNGGVSSIGLEGAIVLSQNTPVISNNIITGGFCAGITSSNASPQILNNQISQTQMSGCAAGEGLGSAIRITGARNPNTPLIGAVTPVAQTTHLQLTVTS